MLPQLSIQPSLQATVTTSAAGAAPSAAGDFAALLAELGLGSPPDGVAVQNAVPAQGKAALPPVAAVAPGPLPAASPALPPDAGVAAAPPAAAPPATPAPTSNPAPSPAAVVAATATIPGDLPVATGVRVGASADLETLVMVGRPSSVTAARPSVPYAQGAPLAAQAQIATQAPVTTATIATATAPSPVPAVADDDLPPQMVASGLSEPVERPQPGLKALRRAEFAFEGAEDAVRPATRRVAGMEPATVPAPFAAPVLTPQPAAGTFAAVAPSGMPPIGAPESSVPPEAPAVPQVHPGPEPQAAPPEGTPPSALPSSLPTMPRIADSEATSALLPGGVVMPSPAAEAFTTTAAPVAPPMIAVVPSGDRPVVTAVQPTPEAGTPVARGLPAAQQSPATVTPAQPAVPTTAFVGAPDANARASTVPQVQPAAPQPTPARPGASLQMHGSVVAPAVETGAAQGRPALVITLPGVTAPATGSNPTLRVSQLAPPVLASTVAAAIVGTEEPMLPATTSGPASSSIPAAPPAPAVASTLAVALPTAGAMPPVADLAESTVLQGNRAAALQPQTVPVAVTASLPMAPPVDAGRSIPVNSVPVPPVLVPVATGVPDGLETIVAEGLNNTGPSSSAAQNGPHRPAATQATPVLFAAAESAAVPVPRPAPETNPALVHQPVAVSVSGDKRAVSTTFAPAPAAAPVASVAAIGLVTLPAAASPLALAAEAASVAPAPTASAGPGTPALQPLPVPPGPATSSAAPPTTVAAPPPAIAQAALAAVAGLSAAVAAAEPPDGVTEAPVTIAARPDNSSASNTALPVPAVAPVAIRAATPAKASIAPTAAATPAAAPDAAADGTAAAQPALLTGGDAAGNADPLRPAHLGAHRSADDGKDQTAAVDAKPLETARPAQVNHTPAHANADRAPIQRADTPPPALPADAAASIDPSAPAAPASARSEGHAAVDSAGLRAHVAYQSAPAPQAALGQVAMQMFRNVREGHTRFEIRIDPPEMGRIDVRLELDGKGTVRARLAVERPETLDLLQRDQRALERALVQAGLDGGKTTLEFSLKQQNQGSAFGGDNQGQGHRNGQPGAGNRQSDPAETSVASAVYSAPASAGGVNLFV